MPVIACLCITHNEVSGYKTVWKRLNPKRTEPPRYSSSRNIPTDLPEYSEVDHHHESLDEHAGTAFEEAVQRRAVPLGLHLQPNGRELIHFRIGVQIGISAVARDNAPLPAPQFLSAVTVIEAPSGEQVLDPLWDHAGWLRSVLEKYVRSGYRNYILEDFWNEGKQVLRACADVCYVTFVLQQDADDDHHQCSTIDAFLKESMEKSEHRAQVSSMPLSDPKMAVISLLEEFGPLLFPLYRNSLLASRVLLVPQDRMERCCKFASILSTLQEIPTSIVGDTCDHCGKVHGSSIVPNDQLPDFEQKHPPKRALMSTVLEDIRFLDAQVGQTQASRENHWIACTFDSSLAQQHGLFDIRINLSHKDFSRIHRPSVLLSGNRAMLVPSQRDHRSYQYLRRALHHLDTFHKTGYFGPSASGSTATTTEDAVQLRNSPEHHAEWESDINMLLALPDLEPSSRSYPPLTTVSEFGYERDLFDAHARGALERRIFSYFKHLTERIFKYLGGLDVAAECRDTASGKASVFVYRQDLVELALDPENDADKEWVREMMRFYFERETRMY